MALLGIRTLPFTQLLKGPRGTLSVIVDKYNDSHFEELCQLYQHTAKGSDGFSKEETSREMVKSYTKTKIYTTMVHEKTGQLVGFTGLFDCAFVRSEKSLTQGIHTVVHANHRGYGIAKGMCKFYFINCTVSNALVALHNTQYALFLLLL